MSSTIVLYQYHITTGQYSSMPPLPGFSSSPFFYICREEHNKPLIEPIVYSFIYFDSNFRGQLQGLCLADNADRNDFKMIDDRKYVLQSHAVHGRQR